MSKRHEPVYLVKTYRDGLNGWQLEHAWLRELIEEEDEVNKEVAE